ncbi:MAG TPA: type II toxin-antitoxin system RelE/ParE family toxin [Candidatus Elarobacter sp.]|jgi:proteic killer suppression protein
MIRSFADGDTERLFGRQGVRRFQAFARVALRKLAALNAATSLVDLKGAGYSLEALKHDRKGQHAIRINEQWRVCFRWRAGDAYEVQITDYH